VAGAGGVIYDSEGKKIVEYSWGLGKATNNIEDILAVYMGLNLAQEEHSNSNYFGGL
jgi:ribonuclease HI